MNFLIISDFLADLYYKPNLIDYLIFDFSGKSI